MNLNELTLDVRPIPAWQALDGGVKLGIRHYLNMLIIWITIALPIFIISGLVFDERIDIWTSIMWWCKPVMEHGMLVYLSRKVFQQSTTWHQIVKSLISPKSGLLGSLTYRRFSLRRSALQPVAVLERHSLRIAIKRRHFLKHQMGAPAWFLTFVMMHIEFFLTLGTLSLIIMVIPEYHLHDAWDKLTHSFDDALLAYNSVWITVVALLAPIYTSAGFCLYFNARSTTEGWDLESPFREIGAAMTRPATGMLVVIVTLSCFFPSQDTWAKTRTITDTSTPQEAHQILIELKKHPPLGEEQTFKELANTPPDQHPFPAESLWLKRIAQGFEILVWTSLSLLLFLFVNYLRKHHPAIRAWITHRNSHSPALSTRWIPKEITINTQHRLVCARQQLAAGAKREAMSELMMCILSAVALKGIPVNLSSTINHVCEVLSPHQESWAAYSIAVLKEWVNLAWAHQDNTSLSTIEHWINQWEQHFSHQGVDELIK